MLSETRVRIGVFGGSHRVEVTLGTQLMHGLGCSQRDPAKRSQWVMLAARFVRLVHAALSTVRGWAKEDR